MEFGTQISGAKPTVVPLRLLGMMTLLYGINAFASTLLIARDRPGAYTRVVAPMVVVNVALNAALIPSRGADGAAFAATFTSALLALLALWQAHVVVGRADVVGAFAGPLLGCAAMAAVVLALSLPWVVEAIAGGLVYAVVFAAWEWTVRRDDALVLLSALPGSRFRAGRTTA